MSIIITRLLFYGSIGKFLIKTKKSPYRSLFERARMKLGKGMADELRRGTQTIR